MRRLALSACLLALAASAQPAAAAAPASWGALSNEVATSWAKLQNSNGTFPDYVYGGRVSFCAKRHCPGGPGNARYGESVLGFGLIQAGVREHDTGLADAGLRALDYIVRRRDLQRKLPTNFESMAVAGAYNLARRKLAHRPLFAHHRGDWERWLRGVKPQWIGSNRAYFNHTLVEAVSNLELFRTGLRSKVRGAVLSRRERPRLERLTRRVLVRVIPREARRTARSSHGVRGEVLSDRPDYPLAYHGFSVGLYAHALSLLGGRAPAAAKGTLRRLVDASWLLTGPDGDVSYAGRSQEDVWALPATTLGAEYAAHLRGTAPAAAARYEAVADRTVARMDTAYGVGPRGLWIAPALAVDPVGGLRGIDSYAGAAAFGGLALMELEWSLDAASGARSPGQLAADSDGASAVMRGDDSTALVRHADLWYAVRRDSSITYHDSDLRYDFGLVALKQLHDGAWHDLQPLRPTTSGDEADSAGPLLVLRAAGGEGIPYGSRIAVNGAGTTTVTGGFRSQRPALRWLRRGVPFTFQPVSCGMQISFPARAGDSLVYSAFMRGTKSDVALGQDSVSDAGQVVSYNQADAQVTLQGGYSSGDDPALVRARIHFQPQANTTIAITVCSR